MYRRQVGICLALLLLPGLVFAAEEQPSELAVLLYVSFDGDATPVAPGADVTVSGDDGLEYGEGKVGKAADFLQSG